MKTLRHVLAIATIALLAGCSSDSGSTDTTVAPAETTAAAAPAKVLRVVTTTTQITDFVRNIGGDNVNVYPVLKANVDPHDYEVTPGDIDAIAKADVLVKNGVGLEKWFDDTIRSADTRAVLVDASTGVTIRNGNGTDEEKDGDPHIWHNPQNAKIMVTNIAKALVAADPAAKATFEKNLGDYSAKLDALDANVKAQIDTLANKKLVTNHDAFGYYVDHYGLEFVGAVIPSFDTQAELSPTDINDLVAKIKAEGVKAVFSESSLPPKTAEALGKEAGIKVVAGEDALFGDTLGADGSDGDTFLKMVAHNTREIVENLK